MRTNPRLTQKEVRAAYNYVICVPYCGLQHLLKDVHKIGHTERREGWGCDVYDYGEVAITTGYAPFGSIRPSYDLIRDYDQKTERLVRAAWDLGTTLYELQQDLELLAGAFIDAALREAGKEA